MKTNVYGVFDIKAANYGPPFFMPRDQMALRSFSDFANDLTTIISKHPEDFVLFRLGEFDDETGQLTPTLPVNLGSASSFVKFDLGGSVEKVLNGVEVGAR